jgi:hypothetical protein
MARTKARPAPTEEQKLEPVGRTCPSCGRRMWDAYTNHRTVTTLQGVIRLHLQIQRCPHPECPRFHRPYRPEAEGSLALPGHEFGLEVIAAIGALRYVEHRSVPEIHVRLRERGVEIAERTVTHLLHRYDELLALALSDPQRLREITAKEGRVILALDGLQPDVGQEVLWVLRDCLCGEVLLAKSLLSATATRLRCPCASELQPRDLTQWRQQREALEKRQHVRRRGLRFRRDPQAYLEQLEADLLKLALPSQIFSVS